MCISNFPVLLIGCILFLAGAPGVAIGDDNNQQPESKNCLGCHGISGFAIPSAEGKKRELHVGSEEYSSGVHTILKCVECHTDIERIPHQVIKDIKVDCISCHQKRWKAAQEAGTTGKYKYLGTVAQQIDHYKNSIHAQPSKKDPSKPNAYCSDCHSAHYITPINSKRGEPGRLKIPDLCGKCHSKQVEAYAKSVHGNEVFGKKNAKAAVCVDCHTTHSIDKPKGDQAKLVIGKNCGNCHEESMESYRETYHGQVNTLGETQTAKCYNCHGAHEIKRIKDPTSLVHVNNRLETCSKCHKNASEGFLTFQPHGNTHDYERYPEMYVVSKFMIGLLFSVFAFFYMHSALWFYAEYRDRKRNKGKQHIDINKINGAHAHAEETHPEGEKYVRRFGWIWRTAHLALALGVMMLVISGMALLFAGSTWAPIVIKMLGGVKIAGIVHRIGGMMFVSVFFGHVFYLIYFISTNWKTWKVFGPNSMVPNLNDLKGVIGMFKWFFDKGPRPVFDRWAYWEKFDYWAPFWGLTIVGVSGTMLWLPELTSHFLPGWVFNVGTIVHGEEAFLAAVFLFSVHFFNCHFRPDKFPQDICMFTGCVPLHEYKHEHSVDYQRLVDSGELEKYLVDPPSKRMTSASKILGATLIIIGVVELVLVLNGFFGH
ncbi:MAG: cytochrome C [Gallionella sp.]|nr:MAG: cytochrome C [Gallionella sp.]